MDTCPACLEFAVITFLSFMSSCFLQLSARNIHLLSRYSAAGEVFDNIYKTVSLHVQGLGDRLLQCPVERYKTTHAR